MFRWKWNWTVWWTSPEQSVLLEFTGTMAQKAMWSQTAPALLFVLTMGGAKSWDMRTTRVCHFSFSLSFLMWRIKKKYFKIVLYKVLKAKYFTTVTSFFFLSRSRFNWYWHVCSKYPVEPHWQRVGCGRLPEGCHSG